MIVALALLFMAASADAQGFSRAQRTLVLYGDSNIRGVTLTRGRDTLGHRLQSRLPHWNVITYARGGWTAGNEHFGDWDLAQDNPPGLASLWPEGVVVSLGHNDWAIAVRPDEFRIGYRAAIAAAHNPWEGPSRLWCVTPFPRCDEPKNTLGLVLDDYRQLVREECAAAGGTVIEGPALIAYEPALYENDCIHANAYGVRVIARRMAAIIGGAR